MPSTSAVITEVPTISTIDTDIVKPVPQQKKQLMNKKRRLNPKQKLPHNNALKLRFHLDMTKYQYKTRRS